MTWHRVCGWVGVVSILTGYFLLVVGFFPTATAGYHGFNLFGSSMLAIDLARQKAWSGVALQIVFAILAAWAIVQSAIISFFFWF